MYFQVHGFFNLNAASAIAVVNILLTLVAILALSRYIRGRQFITVTSLTRRAELIGHPGARIFANAYCWLLLILALLPQSMVIFSSFAEKWAGTLFPLSYGLGNYIKVFTEITDPVFKSLILAGGATAICIVFGSLTAYASIRHRFFGKWALDLTIMLPFVLPGIVTGVALRTTFNDGMVILTGGAAILVLAYFIRRLAYIFRFVSAAMAGLDPRLEEASSICGASWERTMRKVVVPLIAPGIFAGAILVFAPLISEMSATIMLYSPRWKTISIAIFEKVSGDSDEILEASAIGSITIILTLLMVFFASKLVGKSMSDLFR